jgi:hypothetical protein
MALHLGVEHAVESGLHQGAEEVVDVVERFGLGGDFPSVLLGLELEGSVQA